MKKIKSYALLFLLLIGGTAYGFQENKTPYLSETFKVNAPGELVVTTSGSAISVKGDSGNEVLVEMYVKYKGKEVSAKNSEVEGLLENYELDFIQSGNKVSVSAKQKGNIKWNSKERINLSFIVSVPYETSTVVKSSGGSISMVEISGNHEVHTSGGSVKISDSKGELLTKSSGGSFLLDEFIGNADIQTSGGYIKVNNLTGDIAIASAGGSVTLEEISGSIDVSSSGGSIKAQLNELEKGLTMKSSGGSITAIVPEGMGLDLDLRGGRVKSTLANFNGEIKDDKILGKMNGGGIPVKMESSGGIINLEFTGK